MANDKIDQKGTPPIPTPEIKEPAPEIPTPAPVEDDNEEDEANQEDADASRKAERKKRAEAIAGAGKEKEEGETGLEQQANAAKSMFDKSVKDAGEIAKNQAAAGMEKEKAATRKADKAEKADEDNIDLDSNRGLTDKLKDPEPEASAARPDDFRSPPAASDADVIPPPPDSPPPPDDDAIPPPPDSSPPPDDDAIPPPPDSPPPPDEPTAAAAEPSEVTFHFAPEPTAAATEPEPTATQTTAAAEDQDSSVTMHFSGLPSTSKGADDASASSSIDMDAVKDKQESAEPSKTADLGKDAEAAAEVAGPALGAG